MIEFFFDFAPDPMKEALFLEEAGVQYERVPVGTREGEASRRPMGGSGIFAWSHWPRVPTLAHLFN